MRSFALLLAAEKIRRLRKPAIADKQRGYRKSSYSISLRANSQKHFDRLLPQTTNHDQVHDDEMHLRKGKDEPNVRRPIWKRVLFLIFLAYWCHRTIRSSSVLAPSSLAPTYRHHENSAPSKDIATYPSSSSPFHDLQLFVSAFPGGFPELQNTLIKTLNFLWPSPIRMVIVLDDTVLSETNTTKQDMNQQVHEWFQKRPDAQIDVAYNPRSNKTIYGVGWYIQQLIMLWGDNFTNATWIGFMDDDSLVTKAVLEEDLFDSHGRPHTIVRFRADGQPRLWHQASNRAYRQKSFVNAMSYFPVIVKRDHLPGMRQAMLNAHPEFSYFDELYLHLLKGKPFSQFFLMFDHVWREHRQEYAWHFDNFPKGINESDFEKLGILPGTPSDIGVTPEMLQPFPRCVMHGSYMGGKKQGRKWLVRKAMRKAYCNSLPLLPRHSNHLNESSSLQSTVHTNATTSTADYYVTTPDEAHCSGKHVYEDPNIRYEWAFEERVYGLGWPLYDMEGVKRAHRSRILRNQPRQWDSSVLQELGIVK